MAIQIYADGSDVNVIAAQARDDRIAGFTTNPSLMRAAGVKLYRAGALEILRAANGKPVSVEVLSDDPVNMEREARGIAALAGNAIVKIPIVNSRGEAMVTLIDMLLSDGIPVNATAVFTHEQIEQLGTVVRANSERSLLIVSVFAGRIADTGRDPQQHVMVCREVFDEYIPEAKMLWASSRQVYDLELADQAGCDIITMTADLLKKLPLIGKDLTEYSRETAAQFHRDAQQCKYAL